MDNKPAPVKKYVQVRIVLARCAAINALAMPHVKCHCSTGTFATIVNKNRKIDDVRPNPN